MYSPCWYVIVLWGSHVLTYVLSISNIFFVCTRFQMIVLVVPWFIWVALRGDPLIWSLGPRIFMDQNRLRKLRFCEVPTPQRGPHQGAGCTQHATDIQKCILLCQEHVTAETTVAQLKGRITSEVRCVSDCHVKMFLMTFSWLPHFSTYFTLVPTWL